MAKKAIYNCLGITAPQRCPACRIDRELARSNGTCTCFKDQPYRKLEEPDPSEQESMMIMFYANEVDEEGTMIEVERDLCTADLCQLLSIKLGLSSCNFWSIVEYWVNKDYERVLEDHEYMLAAYNDMKRFVNMDNVRYIYRQVIEKYDFLRDPGRYFLPFRVVVEDKNFYRKKLETYFKFLVENEGSPTIFNTVLHKQDKKWLKTYLLLRGANVYVTTSEKVIRKFKDLANHKQMVGGFIFLRELTDDDLIGLNFIGHLSDYQIYRVRRKITSSSPLLEPYTTAIVLRPSVEAGASASDKILHRFSCGTDSLRLSWISAMRLAKYGKQIRENYRAFRNKQNEIGAKEFSSLSVPNVSREPQSSHLQRESVRSRVAMDFTGKQGRIVEDPVEANEIALAEGYMWKRRHKIASRRPMNTKLNENHVDVGIHTMQPWFHSNLSRDQASTLVSKYGNGDGVFIVRPSRTSEGTFVLTYKCQGKLVHQQIIPMTDRERNITVFTLDNGQTKFYDILQLVEFYTVNHGPLMCRLTHYITENANIHNPNIPSSSNAPEYVNVAVNTEISIIVNSENANVLESPSGSSKSTSPRSLGSRYSPK